MSKGVHSNRTQKSRPARAVSRREVLQMGAGWALGGTLLPCTLAAPTRAAEHAELGTYPGGIAGPSVFVGICTPRTGPFAATGEDEIKGYQLAIEHLNLGDPLLKKISPRTTHGVLGKEVKYGIADSEANPNTAVQAQSRFISEKKAMLITGCASSAVARN
jgi:ABC-type branched-subunit amino acid transport system substrate-binding protein